MQPVRDRLALLFVGRMSMLQRTYLFWSLWGPYELTFSNGHAIIRTLL